MPVTSARKKNLAKKWALALLKQVDAATAGTPGIDGLTGARHQVLGSLNAFWAEWEAADFGHNEPVGLFLGAEESWPKWGVIIAQPRRGGLLAVESPLPAPTDDAGWERLAAYLDRIVKHQQAKWRSP